MVRKPDRSAWSAGTGSVPPGREWHRCQNGTSVEKAPVRIVRRRSMGPPFPDFSRTPGRAPKRISSPSF